MAYKDPSGPCRQSWEEFTLIGICWSETTTSASLSPKYALTNSFNWMYKKLTRNKRLSFDWSLNVTPWLCMIEQPIWKVYNIWKKKNINVKRKKNYFSVDLAWFESKETIRVDIYIPWVLPLHHEHLWREESQQVIQQSTASKGRAVPKFLRSNSNRLRRNGDIKKKLSGRSITGNQFFQKRTK